MAGKSAALFPVRRDLSSRMIPRILSTVS
jgi:hypothetical protein